MHREPIALPQRYGLLGAAKRVKRIDGDAGAVYCPWMIWSERFFMSGESSLGERESLGRFPRCEEQTGKVTPRPIGIWVIETECPLEDSDGSREERSCAHEI